MVSDNREKAGILFVSPWTSLYGAPSRVYRLIKHLNRETFHPVVVLPDKGPLWDRLQALDVPIRISPIQPWFNLHEDSASAALSWLADLPERVQRIMDAVYHWDIKIVHSSVMSVLEGALAAKLTGRPHICTGATNHFAYTGRKNIISPASVYEMLNSLSHTIVPVSSSVKEALSHFVAPTKLRVIHNGIETQSFHAHPSHDSLDPVLPNAESARAPRVCSIGRVSVEKGFGLLIDAAALVVEAYPDALFSVFGPFYDKPLYRRLLQQIKRLNLVDNLNFEGPTERVQEELHATDLLVVSSEVEGLSLVALEAMLAGKPVVSTRCGGPEDIIVDGATGYLVPLDDPEALADAILNVLKDPERARQMGRNGLERVRQHFDIRQKTEQYEALYREVLDGWTPEPAQDKNGEAVLIEAVLETVEKYGGEFYKMGSRFRAMRFLAKVKNKLAYEASKAANSLVRKFRKNIPR
ncbi:MAG: glycosyltransferase family 4 protein [bacterium]|nr:glycosyltransferase family 4 protein [bacterium]